jgi:CheY-like chemotaxis protein
VLRRGCAIRRTLLAGKRVLIAEDHSIIAMDLAHELASGGAIVIGPVATAADALDAIASTNLDGGILDIKLSDRLAFPVADALADRHIPFVFATGYSSSPCECAPVRKTRQNWCHLSRTRSSNVGQPARRINLQLAITVPRTCSFAKARQRLTVLLAARQHLLIRQAIRNVQGPSSATNSLSTMPALRPPSGANASAPYISY